MHTPLRRQKTILTLCLLLLVWGLPAKAQSEPAVIVPDNIAALEAAYILPGCQQFSPDSHFVADFIYIYDLTDGSLHYSRTVNPGGESPTGAFQFSPDGQWFAAKHDGLFAAATNERVFTFQSGSFAFSPDSRYLAVAQDGVYETATGDRLFTIGNDPAFLGTDFAFSPNSRYVAVEGDGLYDIPRLWRNFEIAGSGIFSPDGKWLWIRGGVLLETLTWGQQYTTGSGGFLASFSPDSALMAVPNDGVYVTESGEFLFAFGPNPASFSPDGSLMAVRFVGVYTVDTWEQRLRFSTAESRLSPTFSPDGRLLIVPGDGIYDTQSWERLLDFVTQWGAEPEGLFFSPDGRWLAAHDGRTCTVYGLPDAARPTQNFGVVRPSGKTNIRQRPSASSGVVANTDTPLPVIATNADGSWYKVVVSGQEGWVAASVVRVVYLPDSLPVE